MMCIHVCVAVQQENNKEQRKASSYVPVGRWPITICFSLFSSEREAGGVLQLCGRAVGPLCRQQVARPRQGAKLFQQLRPMLMRLVLQILLQFYFETGCKLITPWHSFGGCFALCISLDCRINQLTTPGTPDKDFNRI
jgi:hypothetical protein